MADPRFYDNAGPFSLARVGELTGGSARGDAGGLQIADVASLDGAAPGELSYCDSVKFKSLGFVKSHYVNFIIICWLI